MDKLKEYNESPNICLFCGEKILCTDIKRLYDVKRKKFCNRSCSASYNNSGKIRNQNGIGISKNVKENKSTVYGLNIVQYNSHPNHCLFCDKEFICTKNDKLSFVKSKKFCDNTCKANYTYKTKINEWKQNPSIGTSKSKQKGALSFVIKYIKSKYDNRCAVCGWNKVNKYSNTSPLEVHHIDGNSENNSEENLILLCPNCHSLTSTYRSLNVGNGTREL